MKAQTVPDTCGTSPAMTPSRATVTVSSQPRLRHELGHQIGLDRFAAAFRAVAGILDAAERGFDRGEAVVVDRDGAGLEGGSDGAY
jgi:hypothetical protein